MDSYSSTSTDQPLWNESDILSDELAAMLAREYSPNPYLNPYSLASRSLVAPENVPLPSLRGWSRVGIYEGWLDRIDASAFDSDMSLPDEALSNLRDVVGEFDFEQYQMETDFLNFVYGLCAVGILSRDHYKQITERESLPFVITRKWLEQNPTYDKQGISWFDGVNNESSWLSRQYPVRQESALSTACSTLQISDGSLHVSGAHSSSSETASTRVNDILITAFEGARRHRIETYRNNFELGPKLPPRDRRPSIRVPFEIHDHFEFLSTFTTPRPHLTHFQLRNLVSPVDKNCIYFTESERNFFRIKRLNS
jgi:hypothetical protein